MLKESVTRAQKNASKPSLAVSAVVFAAAVALMWLLRFQLFPDRFLTLSYNLPLLLCLWHRDPRLLWSLVAAFLGMSAFKALALVSDPNPNDFLELTQWLFQVLNILSGGVAVQLTITFAGRLRRQHAELEEAHVELGARAQEIERQNEELQAQGEEMQQQLTDLNHAHDQLTQREGMLQALLKATRESGDDAALLEGICQAAAKLFGGSATAVAIVEKRGEEMMVRAHCGITKLAQDRWTYASSFAAVVVDQRRTAYLADVTERPDLNIAREEGAPFRSILASPLMVAGKAIGAVEALSRAPRQWNAEHFAIIEWVAAQAGLIVEARASRARLEALVEERTAELQEMFNELEHFSYTITHDMRAPLRSLQGFASLLQNPEEGLSEAERADYLGRIVTSARRMDQLITDALSYSRAVRQEIPLGPVDTGKVLRGILNSYPDLQGPRADVRAEGPLPIVLANEAGMTQCLSNLLTNAVKFVPPGRQPVVRIYGRENNTHARIWVEDNGIGISEQMRPKLFYMFQRASRDYEGTGIGLALVRKVIERMGGAAGVESEPGKGSRFWLELRLAPAVTPGDGGSRAN